MLEIFVYVLMVTVKDKPIIKVYSSSDAAEKSAEAYMKWRDDVCWSTNGSWHWIGSLFRDGRPAIVVDITRKTIQENYDGDWA